MVKLFEMKRTFVVLSFLILLFFIWQIWKDYNRPYQKFQREYKNLLMKKGEGGPELAAFPLGTRQRWIEPLNRIDRCESCHLGVEDPRFSDAPHPFRTHPDQDRHQIEKVGCTICHEGQGLATSLEDAHGPTENWNRAVYHANFMQNACYQCHGEYIQDAAPIYSKGRKMFSEYGCRGCHKVAGVEKIKVGPPLKRIGEKVRSDWLIRWLKNPKEYLPETKMPDFLLTEQETADIAQFLLLQWQLKREESSGSYERGQQILRESRCVTCHSFEGKGGDIGPDLAKIGSKVHPGWLYQWLKNPQKMVPETLMPVYGFTDQDVRDLVTFLMEEYIDLELEEEQVERDARLVSSGIGSRGKELIEKYGCTGCHEIEGVEDRGEIGLELTEVADIHITRLSFGKLDVPLEHRTVPNWLYNKIKNPRVFSEDLKMPDYRFSDEEADALTTYLLSLKAYKAPKEYTLILGEPPSEYNPQGEFGNILEKYRCLVCHRINGNGGDLAPDLTQEGSRVRQGWLEKYLKTPYAIRPILVERMPRLKLSDAEIDSIYEYLSTTLLDDRVEDLSGVVRKMSLSAPGTIKRGKMLFYDEYACNACHQVNLEGGTIGPDLTEAGVRLRPEWIVQYLRDPKTFLSRSVEPVYKLTDEEIEALAAYLMSSKK